MATKTITVTEEAYERLAADKGEKESFSDVIGKLTKRTSILKLVGMLKPREADKIEEHIKSRRAYRRKSREKHYRELAE